VARTLSWHAVKACIVSAEHWRGEGGEVREECSVSGNMCMAG
jgi:hypothetical protein